MAVPTGGSHKIAMKAYHSGYTGDTDPMSYATFAIASGYSGFYDVANGANGGDYDLAWCACMIGEDCPSFFT